ncbi:MAG: peptidylprolyl isomerase [Bacteroidetes bacterium]|nr:peptidylprolyl isomerase [Bacteroidota bacterium]MBL0137247.1 peptidylprolyl isomerase [Bacteroidota bacterium]
MKKSILFLTLILIAVKFTSAHPDSTIVQKDTATIDRIVEITTDFGVMKVKLYNATPQHRDNFIKLVQAGFYDSLLFHRVIKGFMIQGGDPLSKNAQPGVMLGNGDVGYTVPAEFVDSIFHKKGTLCAARTENPEKASSGCQFYIVQGQAYTPEQLNMMEMQRHIKLNDAQKNIYMTLGGTPFLDHNYTVFGEVIEGLDVIDKIAAVQTAPGDRPVQDVRMYMKVVQ